MIELRQTLVSWNYASKFGSLRMHPVEHSGKSLSTVSEGRLQRARNGIPASANEGPAVSVPRRRSTPFSDEAIAILKPRRCAGLPCATSVPRVEQQGPHSSWNLRNNPDSVSWPQVVDFCLHTSICTLIRNLRSVDVTSFTRWLRWRKKY